MSSRDRVSLVSLYEWYSSKLVELYNNMNEELICTKSIINQYSINQ